MAPFETGGKGKPFHLLLLLLACLFFLQSSGCSQQIGQTNIILHFLACAQVCTGQATLQHELISVFAWPGLGLDLHSPRPSELLS